MNSSSKKSSQAKGVNQIHKPLTASRAMQPKMAGQPQRAQTPSLQQRKATPVAPPVYRPQAKAVQPKMNNAQDVRGRLPVAPPVYKPQPAPKVLQLKVRGAGSAPCAPGKVSRQPIAPPVYRPQHSPNALQAKKAEAKVVAQTKRVAAMPPPRTSQQPLASSARPTVVQAKRVAVAAAPPMRPRHAVIQRAVFSKFAIGAEEEIYDKAYPQKPKANSQKPKAYSQEPKAYSQEQADKIAEKLIQAEELEKASKNNQQKLKPKGNKKKNRPKVDKAALLKKEEEERRFQERERERQEEHEKELVEQTNLWRDIELSTQGSAAYLFGLLHKGYATLEAPHRCFLSGYEKQGGVRFENRFGLSRKIKLSSELEDKYRAVHNIPANDCVVHFHCAGNGWVLSFGIKYLVAERLAGDNLIVDERYLNQARAYVGDITGDNVEAKVGAFN